MNAKTGPDGHRNIEVLHEIGACIAASDPLSTGLWPVYLFAGSVLGFAATSGYVAVKIFR